MLDEVIHALMARQHRDEPALLAAPRRSGACAVALTRGALADAVEDLTGRLRQAGVSPGDAVAVAVRPGPAALALLLAAHRLRAVVAFVDPHAGADLVVSRLGLLGPRLVVADAAAQAAASWGAPLARRGGLAVPALAGIAPVVTLGRRLPGCAPALPAARGSAGPSRPDGSDGGDAVVIFTSGSTAAPRAVVHTGGTLAAGFAAVTALVRPVAGRPVVAGAFFALVPALAARAPVLLPARRPARLAADLRRLAAGSMPADVTYLTPNQLRSVLEHGARFSGRVFAGSAPVGAGLLGCVLDAGAKAAWDVYALTECFPVAAVEARRKQAYESGAGGPDAGDLVGSVLPGITVTTAGGVPGRIVIAGDRVCDRYLGEAPHRQIDTGDLGFVTGGRPQAAGAEAELVLAGRSKDMVLRDAENIYPGLYEPALHVPGVQLAILVGVPGRAGEDGNEDLVALIQAADDTPPDGPRRAELDGALARAARAMGSARPDLVAYARIPSGGRSGKPDRAAAAVLAGRLLAERRGDADAVSRPRPRTRRRAGSVGARR